MATIVEVSEGDVAARPARFSYLEWGPVIAGALGAAAISLVFFTFGSALGLSVVSPYPYAGMSVTLLLVLTALFAAVVQVGSFAAGGYLAGRMRTPWLGGVESERQFRDGSHGFAVWAVGILIGACIAVAGAGIALRTAVQTTATLSAGAIAGGGAAMGPAIADRVSTQPSDVAIDLLLRPAPGQMAHGQMAARRAQMAPAPEAPAAAAPATPPAAGTTQTETATTTDPKPTVPATTGGPMMGEGMRMEMRRTPRGELQAPLARVFTTSLAGGGTLAPADRTYLAEVVARQTGLPQAEAEKRVDEAYAAAQDAEAKARAAADKARKMTALAAFLAAATLVIACAAACVGAAAGGRHRDEQVAARMFGNRRFW
ncbi:MAG: hypothetical protein Q8M19_09665 [Reyranella sp.]|nr:hypothetical protein [Reyranella sp.]